MITFMTRMSFLDTAADLDTPLLAQTAEEARIFYMGMVGLEEVRREDGGVSKMWAGFEVALAAYVVACEAELATRGIRVREHLNVAQTIVQMRQAEPLPFEHPPWIEDTDVLKSHRSNIIRRWPEYAKVWPNTPPRMPYIWPFVTEDGSYDLFLSKEDKALLQAKERKLPDSITIRLENL